jgi:exopolyphosphatase/guanosine-5'-triphosphate,3'-diphosphate pyrophosphatase
VIFDLNERVAALHGAVDGRDLRDDTVAALQERFAVDMAQATRVRLLALKLHGALQPEVDDDDLQDPARELGWAAALHELGMMVSHHDHHRHSAYLVANVDAAGFSQSEQRRLASLVLGQRGGLRKIETTLADPAFAWQVLSLRLAVLLCHARQAPAADAVEIRREGRAATLHYNSAWGEAHPRTVYLLAEEQAAWQRIDGGPRLQLPPG